MRGSAATSIDWSETPGTTLTITLEPAVPGGEGESPRVLARLRFRPEAGTVVAAGPTLGDIPLPLLTSDAVDEVWRADRPLAAGRVGDVLWRGNADVIFAALTVPDDDLEAATFTAYEGLLQGLTSLGCYRLLRIWNYFPRIHEPCRDSDRYGLFCRGRHRALTAGLTDFERNLPAASAIGSRQPGLTIQALATRTGGRQIENPRQVSAFHYPPAYAPRSPSFSRSVLAPCADGRVRLYVSGTASIVGHRTCHAGDLAAQLDETLANLAALLAEAGRAAGTSLTFRLLRVYLRGSVDPAWLHATIIGKLGSECPLVILQGDICRSDLLVEIEGVAEGAPSVVSR